MPAADSSPKPPPSRTLSLLPLVLGGVFVVLGATSLALGSWSGLVAMALGAIFLGQAALVRISGDAAALVNRAYNEVLAGRAAEAEALLDQLESRRQLRYIQRVVDLQRALLALRRADRAEAKARIEAALRPPRSWIAGLQERNQIATARAVRALLRAADGDRDGAREDIAAVRAEAVLTPEARARAEVAEAMVREAEGDREALGAHLRAERRLLLDHTTPRERAIVRAYQRMLAAPRTTVYREAAPREPESAGGPSVADWVAQLAPAAAPFARATRAPEAAAQRVEAPGETTPEHRAAANDRLRARGLTAGKLLALWAALIVMFMVIWQVLNPREEEEIVEVAEPTAVAPTVAWALPAIVVAVLIGVVVWRVRGLRAQELRLVGALVPLARGDEGAAAALEALTQSRTKLLAAQAHLHLAREAERRGDFAEARRRCDAGIAACTSQAGLRAVASQILLPDLAAERAVVLAALGRGDEARAEIAVVAESFPAYPYLARGELRVALIGGAREGDLEGAAHAADNAGEAPLPLAEETLADLARAAAHPDGAGPGEVARLREALRTDAGLRRWIEAVAPAVLGAFERAEREAEAAAAEAEAVAEAEAEAAGARGSASA
jgi:hypothetical protein